MSGTCVIGLQWGDEAKGKLVDLLAPQFDLVVRYQGGANAGHTVVAGDEVYKLHHIPSGILHPQVQNLITPGVVINPSTMLDEIDALAKRGVVCKDNLRISERAHLVMPWHMAEDKFINATAVRGESIGTTNRGIGPCYRDKVGRTHAIRMADLAQSTRDERLRTVAEQKVTMLTNMGAPKEDLDSIAPDTIVALANSWAQRLDGMIGDTTDFLLDACEQNKRILFEGAQGALLDIDHGTFPFVTSSNSSGVGVCAGAGVPPRWIHHVIGVCKAYSTRVGGGPFPTELDDEIGDRIRTLGNEFGTTTGRPRRCGWLDAVALRYTARLSGVTRLALMMMDVLSHLDELKICVAYELDGQRIGRLPGHADQLRRCKPIYETIPGWNEPVDDLRRVDQFPAGALRYVRRIEELVGIPVGVLSVGPDRAQTIFTDAANELELQPIAEMTDPANLPRGDLPPADRPRHIAIIMDGNGRWAQSRDLPRIEGHRRGVSTVRMISETATELGIEAVTLYCLSSENWKRPQEELDFLMHLLEQYLVEERRTIMDQGLRLKVIGRRDRLPANVLDQMRRTLEMSADNPGTQLVLAIDYGGRDEITRAVRAISSEVAEGKLSIEDISESTVDSRLYTAGLPEIDLMIRTGGDMRVSNFLLWQLSYAELWITEKCWPEFTREDFLAAICDFSSRQRRFGGLNVNE